MLVRRSYEVTGIDVFEEVLDTARAAASAEPGEVRGRLRFERADLVDLGAGQLEWYGVRLFSDHWGQVEAGDDFDALVEAESRGGPS